MPAISVIMLTYNRQEFVVRAVKSVLDQTFQDFEFIIVDNGSTDGSEKVCASLAQKDQRIVLIRRENNNIGSGRNAGLDIAKGEYVAFIDDDDYCLPNFLGFLYDLVTACQADIAVCGSFKEENGKISPNGVYLYETVHVMEAEKAVENYLWRRLYNCAMPTKLIRCELFDKIRFPEEGNYDDITTAYKYFASAKKIVAHGIGQYVFRRHRGNHSSAATKHYLLNPEQLKEYLDAFAERSEYLSKTMPRLFPLARYSEWSYMISMIEKIHRYELKNCQSVLEYMERELRANLEEFLSGGFILDFEKIWVETYLQRTACVAI